MESSQALDPRDVRPGGGRFARDKLVLALIAGPAVGLMWAWLAEMSQFYVAESLLLSALVGVFIGLTLVGLVRFARIGHRPTILATVVLAAVAAAVVPCVFPADSDSANWPSRLLDVIVILAMAAAVTIPAMRVPFCNRCETWYRTVRNGKIDVPSARRLAEICDIEPVGDLRSPRYRLSRCQGGCGPTRCELSWEESKVGVYLARVWLDDRQREQVEAVLDELATENAAENNDE